MRRALRPLVLIAAVASTLLPGAGVVSGVEPAPYTALDSTLISPGVTYERGTVPVGNTLRNINVVEVDPASDALAVRVVTADGRPYGRRTVLEHALAHSQNGERVVASVNGSLYGFHDYDEGVEFAAMGIGINIIDGELINAGNPPLRPNLPVLGIDASGAPKIGVPQVTMDLTLPGGSVVQIDKLNGKRGEGQTVMYTSTPQASTWTNDAGDEYVIEGFDLPLPPSGTHTGQVVAVNAGSGDTEIGPNQLVLSASNTAAEWPLSLAVGDTVTFAVTITSGWEAMVHSVSGRDLLLQDGVIQPWVQSGDGDDARTVVGIDAQGQLLMVTVDDGSYVHGLSMRGLAELMLSLGAVDAANLDGGTSSQMAVRLPGDVEASVVNTIYKPIDRPVVNALQVISLLPTQPLDKVLITPAAVTAAVGQPVALGAKGHDTSFNGIPLDPTQVRWAVTPTGKPATMKVEPDSPRATLTPLEVGDYTVTIVYGALTASARIKAVADTMAPSATRPFVTLAGTEAVPLDKAYLSVEWLATDNVHVQRVQLQRRIGTGSWRSMSLPGGLASAATITVPLGKRVQFRVRGTDSSGNVGTWAVSEAHTVAVYNERHVAVSKQGAWESRPAGAAFDDAFARSGVAGASVSLSVHALQVLAVGNSGPTNGDVDLVVNGATLGAASLNSSTVEYRQVIFVTARRQTQKATTTIALVNAGTTARPHFDFDAFLVLRRVN